MIAAESGRGRDEAANGSRRRPERRCVACGHRGPQDSFLRYRLADSGGEGPLVRRDEDGEPRSGRGAYMCPRRACMDRALRKRAFQRALRVSAIVNADELLEALERLLSKRDWESG
jgi:predicted RNA-binding protein YlxR (DUF448 family)